MSDGGWREATAWEEELERQRIKLLRAYSRAIRFNARADRLDNTLQAFRIVESLIRATREEKTNGA
jgi:hypothetical protein